MLNGRVGDFCVGQLNRLEIFELCEMGQRGVSHLRIIQLKNPQVLKHCEILKK